MSGRPPPTTLPDLLRRQNTRLERLERLPRGNGLPAGGGPGTVLGFDPEGKPTWTDPLPPGGEDNDVLTQQVDPTGANVRYWAGPIWWAWVGTEDQYNALGSWDDKVLYVIIQEEPGAVTTVTPEDLSHTP